MKLLSFGVLFILAFVFAGCSRSNSNADEMGNGGDELSRRMERARTKLGRILEAVREVRADEAHLATLVDGDEIVKFFRDRRDFLIAENWAMTEYRWVKKNPNGKCGQTGDYSGAPISFSIDDCRNLKSDFDAALQILVELVHHAGKPSDSFAARTAVIVGEVWNRQRGAEIESIEKQILFEQSVAHAAEATVRLTAAFLDSPQSVGSGAAASRQFILKNKDRYAQFLRGLSLEGTDELPDDAHTQRRCVRHSPADPTTLFYSYGACDVGLRKEAMGRMILAATLKAFLPEPSESETLALAISDFWQQTHPERAHLLSIPWEPEVRSKYGPNTHVLWTGDELITWRFVKSEPKPHLMHFRPRTNQWTDRDSENSYLPWFEDNGDKFKTDETEFNKAVWVAGRALVFTECSAERRKSGVGHWYDPKTNRWELIPEIEGINRRHVQVLVHANEMVVWGGEDCTSGASRPSGFSFNIDDKKWTALPPIESFRERYSYTATVAGDGLFLWGGCNYVHDRCSNAGARYDFATRTWRELPTKNAPTARWFHHAIATETHLVVFGGVPEFPSHYRTHANGWEAKKNAAPILSTGARFNFRELKWETMRTENALPYPIWAASGKPYVIALCVEGFSLYNPVLDRWTSNRTLATQLTPIGFFWTGAEYLLWDGYNNHMLYL